MSYIKDCIDTLYACINHRYVFWSCGAPGRGTLSSWSDDEENLYNNQHFFVKKTLL